MHQTILGKAYAYFKTQEEAQHVVKKMHKQFLGKLFSYERWLLKLHPSIMVLMFVTTDLAFSLFFLKLHIGPSNFLGSFIFNFQVVDSYFLPPSSPTV